VGIIFNNYQPFTGYLSTVHIILKSFICQCNFLTRVMHVAVNACLWPLCAVHGKAVTTVEGVGDTDTGLHAVQVTIVTIFHIRGFKLIAEQLVFTTI